MLKRVRTFWQKARRFDRDLKDRGATRAQRLSMMTQKVRTVLMPAGTRRHWVYARMFRPLARPLLGWAHRQRQGHLPLWDRWEEFQPVVGELGDQEILAFPHHDAPRCTILVPVFGKWRHTYACLRSVLRNTQGVRYEVLVLDDHSPDETLRLAEIVHGVRFVRHAENLGFLRNCNEGAKQARGETLLFLNNDTCVEPGWLAALHEVLDQDPAAGLVGARLLDADGRLQEAGGIVWHDGSGWNYGRGADPSLPEYGYRKESDYCSGACILIPSSLWRALGGFDERFAPAYYEDTDLAFAVRAAGRKCVHQPRAAVVHLEGVSHGTDVGSGMKRYQELNRAKFAAKWAAELADGQSSGPDHLFVARDRSQRSAHVLVVDEMVPAWDAEAGARLTYMYLKLLVEEGFRVHFAPANLFPAQPHTRRLEDLGIEVLHGHAHGTRHAGWLAEHGRRLHAAHLHRPDVADAYLPLLRAHAPQARLVYQCHDLHFLREQRRHEAAGGTGPGREAERWRQVEERVMRAVDVVHTPSSFERDWITAHVPQATVRDVPIYFWDHAPLDGAPRDGGALAGRTDLLFVGGRRHPPNEDGVNWFVREVLPLIRAARPDARLRVVGGHWKEARGALAAPGVQFTGRLDDDQLGAAYRNARVALIPLRYGAGVKGKLIEAYAWGVPAVATPVGAEGVPDVESCTAIAADARAFADAVLQLLNDDRAWRAARVAGLELVARAYSTSRARDIIRADFARTPAPAGTRAAHATHEAAR
jgi:GT2 family glycosyltransferase/glycosyltransferase involved in cell wall biosynthesis